MSNGNRIALAELIGELRKELIKAQRQGGGEDIRFLVEEVEVEVEVASSRKASGEAGVDFWVVKSKIEGEKASESTQTLRLKLKPRGPGGKDGVEVGDERVLPK